MLEPQTTAELADIFSNLPFIFYFIFGLIGGAILWCSFIILESRRMISGFVILSLGVAILLSDGFAVIGVGPLGWVPHPAICQR